MEILIVVIIIGILTTLALPNFYKTIESSRAELAKTVLRQIYTAERMYHLAFPSQPYTQNIATPNPNNDLVDWGYLQSDPNTGIEGEYFDYSITSASASAPYTFTARATRNSGSNNGDFITINQAGTIDETGFTP